MKIFLCHQEIWYFNPPKEVGALPIHSKESPLRSAPLGMESACGPQELSLGLSSLPCCHPWSRMQREEVNLSEENLQIDWWRYPTFSHTLQDDFQKRSAVLSSPTKPTLWKWLWLLHFAVTDTCPGTSLLWPSVSPWPSLSRLGAQQHNHRGNRDLIHVAPFSCCKILFRYSYNFH